jgi:hypothetical protein
MNCYIDTETCGLHGMAVTLQYAFDDGPIRIHNFWTEPIADSLALIKQVAENTVIGFNLAFDWFHLCKMYTTLELAQGVLGGDALPEEHIERIAVLEEKARNGPCLKPFQALDLMLHARKTEFQITMERSDIRIRKVPTALAWSLAKKLEEVILLDPILFARRKNRLAPKWVVHDINTNGTINPDFKDIVLKFRPSMALKALAVHALNIPSDEIILFGDVEVDRAWWPYDLGYAPFALALGKPGNWRPVIKEGKKRKRVTLWPAVIEAHINHWQYNQRAREYASKDVEYTRRLHRYFGNPPADDDDSVLACMVGAVRWRGYAIDIEGIKTLKEAARKRIKEVPTAPRNVKKWISEVLSAEEKATFTSTGKVILEKMASLIKGEPCPFGPCEHCVNGLLPPPPSAKRAADVLEARKMFKEIELYDKLILAGRFHASFKVIGALSGRMAGADQLNAQGIKRTKEVRSKFPLAFGHLKLHGGDFEGFEVVLAEAAYNDAFLRKDLLTCERCRDVQVKESFNKPLKEVLSPEALGTYVGWRLVFEADKVKKDAAYVPLTEAQILEEYSTTFACPKCGGNSRMKIHALFGIQVYPDMDYDQIKATSGSPDDRYNKAKSAVFAMIYGGEGYTLMTRLGVPIEVANAAYIKFTERYPGVGLARRRVIDAFCSIRQEGGPGSKIVWKDPHEYVENFFGFKRYFILENRITKALFALAENPPEEWKNLKVKVRRRDREQTVGGAVQSALFGCTFQIQAANMRAAANHEIQSSGAQITKICQRKLWDVQPSGVNPWYVQPMNVHDEILAPMADEVVDKCHKIIYDAVESFRPRVPLIEFEFKAMKTWAEK